MSTSTSFDHEEKRTSSGTVVSTSNNDPPLSHPLSSWPTIRGGGEMDYELSMSMGEDESTAVMGKKSVKRKESSGTAAGGPGSSPTRSTSSFVKGVMRRITSKKELGIENIAEPPLGAGAGDLEKKGEESTMSEEGEMSKEDGRWNRWRRKWRSDKTKGKKKEPNGEGSSVPFLKLFRFATPLELALNFIGLICAAAAGSAQPLLSIFFGNLANVSVRFGTSSPSDPGYSALRDEFKDQAAKNALYLVFVGIGVLVCTYTYMCIWAYTGEVLSKRTREAYLHSILHQEIAYFDNIGAGQVAQSIQTDTHLVQQGTSEKIPLIVQHTSTFVTGFLVAYIREWKLALALTSILPCVTLLGIYMSRGIGKHLAIAHGALSTASSLAHEVLSSIRSSHAFGSQEALSDLFDTHITRARAAEIKAGRWSAMGHAGLYFVNYNSYALAFAFGTTLVIRGDVNVGVVVSVFYSVLIGSFSIAFLTPELRAVTLARVAASKLFAVVDRAPVIASTPRTGLRIPAPNLRGDISLSHVSFSYPSRPRTPVLRDLSLTFPAGKITALVGASGSGKSTVVHLIERFYDPLKGNIYLDGLDLKKLELKWLRSQIGYVSQEPILFGTTIRENVAHGLLGSNPDAMKNLSEEEIFWLVKEACIKANADPFILKLPNGYETVVGERGFLLSGGQKQRVAIARAIVSDPKVLILDEPTSALDAQNERIVQDALDRAAAGRTTIMIAHRLSTVRKADWIYVLEDGSVLEGGAHDDLLAQGGAYARLVHAQTLRELERVELDRRASSSIPTTPTTPLPLSHKSLSGDDSVDVDVIISDRYAYNLDRDLELELDRMATKSASAAASRGGEEEDHYPEKHHGLTYLLYRMLTMDRDIWSGYTIAFCFAFATGMVWPSFGIVYAFAITAFQSQNDPHVLRFKGDRNALWMFVIAILATISIGMQHLLFSRSGARLTGYLRSRTFRQILRMDIKFFDQSKHSSGALISKIFDSSQKVNGLAGITLGAITQSTTTVIVGPLIGLAFFWKLALVGIATMPLLVSTGYIRLRVVVLKDQQNRRAHEDSAQVACEAAASIRTVASLTAEEDLCRVYRESLEIPLRRSNRVALVSNLIFAASSSMQFYAIALIFWFGSRLVAEREVSTSSFFVCLFSVTYASIQAANVFGFTRDISSAQTAARDIINLLDIKPDIDIDTSQGRALRTVQGEIIVHDVRFHYPTRPQAEVLTGLNFTVKPGTNIALVGASGSGKSTAIQLVERFYDPTSGKIYMDFQDIAELNVQNYRRSISLVSQEPTLYAGSIRFNILLGAGSSANQAAITQEQLEQACRDANILSFIQSLPSDFDTEVGSKGVQLSGGQKQRIAIARALLRNPRILLLDEATSALDSHSEKVVQDALDRAARGRTTISVAHRLATIQNADIIFFIKDGRVSESGTHDHLLSRKGDYYRYVHLQALGQHRRDEFG